MNKSELVELVAEKLEMSKTDAADAVDCVIEGIREGVKAPESSVTLVGFGTFKNVYRKPRKGRNPQTGQEIAIPGKNTVTFKPSKNILD
jgi:DNA-binding protein HU-beta